MHRSGRFLPCLILLLFMLPVPLQADPGNPYCVTPPFLSGGIKSNLLLMIDNSAGMYDLQYQDSQHSYCANAALTACTAGTICPGAATCKSSGSTVTVTSFSPRPCSSDDGCSAARSSCTEGFCSNCNTANGNGDCVSSVSTTFTPTSCSSDADCRPPAAGGVAGDSCDNRCDLNHLCYDTTYDDAAPYYGYFERDSIYSYDFAAGVFRGGAAIPSPTGCSYAAGSPAYLCVQSSGKGSPSESVTGADGGFTASGNFLNWLTMSKFDIEKEVLTGGKFDVAQQVLVAESRGCSGRKFLKRLPGVDLTFAIRGGSAAGLGSTRSQATEYGQTYIDLHAGSYREEDCLSAMNDWLHIDSVKLGPFQNHTRACVGAGNGVLDAVSLWNHILHNCYQGMNGAAQGYGTNLTPLEEQCRAIYATLPPSKITDPNSGAAICSGALSYLDEGGSSRVGYLGACYDSETGSFATPCDLFQMASFCRVNIDTTAVIDPPSTSAAAARASATGFILEQGLMNTVRVGSLAVRVATAAPSGLLQDFQDRLRFGAMTFQNNGSGSECGSGSSIPCTRACALTPTRFCLLDSDCPVTNGLRESCSPLPRTDGGKIIAYLGAGRCSSAGATTCDVDADCPAGEYCAPSLGDHGSGLIHAIDAIPATSWTPLAEAFYNAIGYYARSNAYSASPPASRADAGFASLPSPNSALSWLQGKNPSQYRCQGNNILLITDGMSTADSSSAPEGLASLYAPLVPNQWGGSVSYGISGYDSVNNCPAYQGSRSISALAWIARNRNIKTLAATAPASSDPPREASELITSYVLYTGSPTGTGSGLCDTRTLMENTAQNGGSTLYQAEDPARLLEQLSAAFVTVAAQTSSGTAASILSNSAGSGANILQAIFYPKKIFDNDSSAQWLGELQNLWYYVDPQISSSSIREDSDEDRSLHLRNDKLVRFRFDTASNATWAYLSTDTDGDGAGNSAWLRSDPEQVKSIWRAGKTLWSRDPTLFPRTIYTPLLPGGTGSGNSGLMLFSYGNAGGRSLPDHSQLLQPYLQAEDEAGARRLIKYVHGFDFSDLPPLRSRTVQIGSRQGVWKLGDIVSSTPRIQSTWRLNAYGASPPRGYADLSYNSFTGSREYRSRGMAYVGANDGMLHAFKLGLLDSSADGLTHGRLSGSGLGEEAWAYIPKQALPYLNYASDPRYGHIYYVDGPTAVFDASIGTYSGSGGCSAGNYHLCAKPLSVVTSGNALDPEKNSWRTVLIGSMGLGGASAAECAAGSDCVGTPAADPGDSSGNTRLGYSSYFALDVTDPEQPSLLWEFNHPALGYATSGPAIVRVGAPGVNGKWFAVFGSGPTGPIDSSTHQFLGRSNQTLKFFVVDLPSGELVRVIDTGIADAFSGSLVGGSIDTERWNPESAGNYQDEAIYVGYTRKSEETGSWSDGGVLRISTRESPDPADARRPWSWSRVIDGVGPVTSAIGRLQDKKNLRLWLYFGTGRYYYRAGTSVDDQESQRSIYGIIEPCYNSAASPGNHLDKGCSATVTSGVTDQSETVSAVIGRGGWKVDLAPPSSGLGAERIVSDPVALTNGAIFFTSFQPSADACSFGGNTYLWALDYRSGGAPQEAALRGKALIQLSTGEFNDVDIAAVFSSGTARGGRRSLPPSVGKPPGDGFPVVSRSGNKPVKRILHIQER
jgi:type IV pilus assembly protein PilY1